MNQVGDGELTDRLNAAIDRAIADKRIVGAVVLIARDGKPSFRRAAGPRAIQRQGFIGLDNERAGAQHVPTAAVGNAAQLGRPRRFAR